MHAYVHKNKKKSNNNKFLLIFFEKNKKKIQFEFIYFVQVILLLLS
jgi:hypothetical protein